MVFPVLLLALMVGVGDAWKLTYEASQTSAEGIVCPNGISKCSVGHTCCKLGDDWGCCPFPRATCCSDNVHCCPQGYSCDGLKQQCIQAINNETIPWAKKLEAPDSSREGASSENLVCPDGSSCHDRSACCVTYSGTYRCCDYPNNVCCADDYHCCPHDSVCDPVGYKCIPTFATAYWKTVAAPKSTASIPNGAAPSFDEDN